MFEHRGIWLPDGETHLPGYMDKVPMVEGRGAYQYEKITAALGYCTQFRMAVDVGAHVGLWSMHLARRFESVQAFEPMAQHRECFLRNVLMPRVTLYPVALGAESGHVHLRTYTPGSSGDTHVDLSEPGAILQVTLDSIVVQSPPEVDLLKIDCEGYELFVLRGAEWTLRNCKPVVIVEQKRGKAAAYGLRDTEAVDFLQSLGYVLRREMMGDYILTHGGAHGVG